MDESTFPLCRSLCLITKSWQKKISVPLILMTKLDNATIYMHVCPYDRREIFNLIFLIFSLLKFKFNLNNVHFNTFISATKATISVTQLCNILHDMSI